MASPGPNSPALVGAYVQRTSPTGQRIRQQNSTGLTVETDQFEFRFFDFGVLELVQKTPSPLGFNHIMDYGDTSIGYSSVENDSLVSFFVVNNPWEAPPTSRGYFSVDIGNGLGYGVGAGVFGDDAVNIPAGGTAVPALVFLANPVTGRAIMRTPTLDLGTNGIVSSIDLGSPAVPLVTPAIAPAQVGLPTVFSGTSAGWNRADHRHAFSGRFILPTAFFPVAVGAGFPLNQQIVQINNAWTLRRLWVRCATGPVGGTETYAVVNAAGVVQGTALVLAAGGLETVGALQVTNLAGGTKYYLAQTAVGGGWAAGSTNTHVCGEYTMNI